MEDENEPALRREGGILDRRKDKGGHRRLGPQLFPSGRWAAPQARRGRFLPQPPQEVSQEQAICPGLRLKCAAVPPHRLQPPSVLKHMPTSFVGGDARLLTPGLNLRDRQLLKPWLLVPHVLCP